MKIEKMDYFMHILAVFAFLFGCAAFTNDFVKTGYTNIQDILLSIFCFFNAVSYYIDLKEKF